MDRPPRIALATCSGLPHWECDDRPLWAALETRGVRVSHPEWDDAAVDWSALDACLVRTTWDYPTKRDAFVDWAERVGRCIPVFNPPGVIRWNTDKSYLRELADRGLPVAPTVWLEHGESVDVSGLVRDNGWEAGFLKPCVGATSRETLRFETDAEGLARAQQHLDRMLATEDMLLQPYLRSVEIRGEISVVLVEGRVTHAVRKRPVRGDYRTQDDFGAKDEPYDPTPREHAVVDAVVAALPDLLYARVDLLDDEHGVPVINELELVEPSLFFRHGREAAERLAEALLRRL